MSTHHHVGRRVLETEINALSQLADTLAEDFDTVIDTLVNLQGQIILAGVGKSGHVARKIAATLASTGSRATYIHPTEASHGDMGMITQRDAVIALSRSGETQELADMISFCGRFQVPLMAITAVPHSTLGRAATHVLAIPDAPEACGETRAPTTSTTLQIALGDALAIALLEAKGFTAADFKTFHPGGALGAALLSVSDLMHTEDALPLVDIETHIAPAVEMMSAKGFGCVGVTQNAKLVGMITDGDIRRHMGQVNMRDTVSTIMSSRPRTVAASDLAAHALRQMTAQTPKVTQVFVIKNDKPIGILHLHDLLRAGLA